MEKPKCDWCKGSPLYEKYHDTEWGVPLFDEQVLFEFLILETFQAGLSWITVLRKREDFRKAFDQFDYKKIAAYDSSKEQELLQNSKIIRNRLKISATISNAEAFMKIQKQYGSFSDYIWGFVDGKPITNTFKTLAEVPAKTPLAETISKDLKQNGFKFVGPTVIYAHMQATGMVNDHLTNCFRYKEVNLKR
ncbi:DNA-3-methyladenine glycosylase I [Flavobacteriaceae bacterium]|nr:DNA-3-methyladenine glycosylase I [Flavobacteriaceae bacterium]MDB2340460.1 DNA-3-methyladenine glycosylase I [Flavobacteriaceae bacterium]